MIASIFDGCTTPKRFSTLHVPTIAEEPYTIDHGKCQVCSENGKLKVIDEERDLFIDIVIMQRDEGRRVLSGVITCLTFDPR